MGNFAENLNLGNRFRPPLILTEGSMPPASVERVTLIKNWYVYI